MSIETVEIARLDSNRDISCIEAEADLTKKLSIKSHFKISDIHENMSIEHKFVEF